VSKSLRRAFEYASSFVSELLIELTALNETIRTNQKYI